MNTRSVLHLKWSASSTFVVVISIVMNTRSILHYAACGILVLSLCKHHRYTITIKFVGDQHLGSYHLQETLCNLKLFLYSKTDGCKLETPRALKTLPHPQRRLHSLHSQRLHSLRSQRLFQPSRSRSTAFTLLCVSKERETVTSIGAAVNTWTWVDLALGVFHGKSQKR